MSAPGARPLRVLMTADTVGGVWTHACELIGALAPLDVHVTLATLGARLTPAQARTAAALPNVELAESTFAAEWMPDPWRDVDAAGAWLLDLAAACRADVVHVHGYAHAALPFAAPVIAAAHACVLSWHLGVRGTEPGPEWTEYRARARRGLQLADAVVAPTAAILRAICDAHAIPRRGRVIAYGRGPAAWRPAAKEPFVLSAGRLWDEAKGIVDLDACAARVAWPIHVAGPTSGPGGVGRVSARGVRLLGELPADALAGWMGRAAIFALPARYEPFGMSILEAALAGCALVLGDLSTLREVWGDAAVYVPGGDPDALAHALRTLARDDHRREQLAARARTRALTLSPRRMGIAYRALYDEQLVATRRLAAMFS